MSIDNSDIERAFSEEHGGVAPELEEAGDMSTSDGLGGGPESGPLGHDHELAFDPLSQDDVENLLIVADSAEHIGLSVSAPYLRKLARRIAVTLGAGLVMAVMVGCAASATPQYCDTFSKQELEGSALSWTMDTYEERCR